MADQKIGGFKVNEQQIETAQRVFHRDGAITVTNVEEALPKRNALSKLAEINRDLGNKLGVKSIPEPQPTTLFLNNTKSILEAIRDGQLKKGDQVRIIFKPGTPAPKSFVPTFIGEKPLIGELDLAFLPTGVTNIDKAVAKSISPHTLAESVLRVGRNDFSLQILIEDIQSVEVLVRSN